MSLDVDVLRLARTRGHSPAGERAVAGFSRARRARRVPGWRSACSAPRSDRPGAGAGCARSAPSPPPTWPTRRSSSSCAAAPAAGRPAGADEHADPPELPERPRGDLLRRRAAPTRGSGCPPDRCTRSRAARALAAVPRRALPVDAAGRRRARTALSPPPARESRREHEDRHRRDAQRRQVSLFTALTGAAAEAANYPFTTIEPNMAIVPVVDRAPGRAWPRRCARPSSCTTRSPSTTSPAWSPALAGRGPGQPVPGQHPRDRRDLHVVRAHDDQNVVHPEGRVDPLADIETIETELVLADLEQAERRLDRVAKAAKSGDRARDRRGRVAARASIGGRCRPAGPARRGPAAARRAPCAPASSAR